MVDKIEKLLEEKYKEEEFQDCFTVAVKLNTPTRMEIFIDCDNGLTLRKCQKISRYLETYIEENNWMPEQYSIDVSSPGIGRPLTLLRQYKNNIGRKIEITPVEGKKMEGKVVGVEDENVLIEMKVRVEGKKKKELKTFEIPFQGIKKGVIKISFK